MRLTMISSVAFVALTLLQSPMSVAQAPATSTRPDACHKVPTRACLLDEALTLALSVAPSASRSSLLGTIAEAQAVAGNVQAALQIAQSIPSDQIPHVTALRAIASAQARLGLTTEARETFSQARQLADALENQLSRAVALQSVAQAQADAGMVAEANSTFEASLNVAQALELSRPATCRIAPAPEDQLDFLFRTLAEQQARAGNISNSLQTARLIKYHPDVRAVLLRTIAEIQAQGGQKAEAGLTFKEALEAAQASPPEHWPSCPTVRHVTRAEFQAGTLSDIAKAQARTGLLEDAAATFEAALQLIPSIKDGALGKADASRSFVLTRIAEAQSEAGLGPQSAATFERAVEAASEVREPKWQQVLALARLGGAQHKAGRAAEATRTFDDALELALGSENYPERANGLLMVVDVELDVGLADTDALLQALEATRSIPDQSRRVFSLVRVAQAQEQTGRLEAAVDTYREALEAVNATSIINQARANSLFLVLRGWGFPPGRPEVTRLIAESAAQAVQIAESIEDAPLRRAEAFAVIARALPN
jgi:tetratricopeptide (TPR) repeat protein